MPKRVLVTGGSGFIGSHIIDILKKQNYEVISLSINQTNKKSFNKEVQYIKHDLTQEIPDSIIKKLNNVNYIINCASYINHSLFYQDGQSVIKSQFNILMNLLDERLTTNLEKFIQIGSSDEYGNCPSPIRESIREMPISSYSIGKLTCTNIIQAYSRERGIQSVILRPFIVFGERQGHDRFLPYLISNCLNGATFGVTEGKQLRDYLYVQDLAIAVINSIETNDLYGEIINVGSGIPISIKQLTMKVRDLIGSGNPIFGQKPYRKSESMALYPDISKAREKINWQPTRQLDESLVRVIKWFKSNA